MNNSFKNIKNLHQVYCYSLFNTSKMMLIDRFLNYIIILSSVS